MKERLMKSKTTVKNDEQKNKTKQKNSLSSTVSKQLCVGHPMRLRGEHITSEKEKKNAS